MVKYGLFHSEMIVFPLFKWNLYFYLCNGSEIRSTIVIFLNAITWFEFTGPLDSKVWELVQKRDTRVFRIIILIYTQSIQHTHISGLRRRKECVPNFLIWDSGMDRQVDPWMVFLWFPINSRKQTAFQKLSSKFQWRNLSWNEFKQNGNGNHKGDQKGFLSFVWKWGKRSLNDVFVLRPRDFVVNYFKKCLCTFVF